MSAAVLRGPWDHQIIENFLASTVLPIRLAYHGTRDFPVVASHWFIEENGLLLCAVQRDSHTARMIDKNPYCAFEIAGEAPPYRGVRGQALATLEDTRGAEVLDRLIDRYLGDENKDLAKWLRSRSHSETAICLEPTHFSSWDYSDRMDHSNRGNAQ